MDEVVERVAKAILDSLYPELWDKISQGVRDRYRGAARNAIRIVDNYRDEQETVGQRRTIESMYSDYGGCD